MKKIVTASIVSAIFVIAIANAARLIELYKSLGKPEPIQVTAVEAKETEMVDTMSLDGVFSKIEGIEAVLYADEKQGKKIKKGMNASVAIQGLSAYHESKVSEVSRLGDETYRIVVPLPNKLIDLETGASLQATIFGKTEVSIIAVPWTAIDKRDGTHVWILDGDSAYRVEVRLGAYDQTVVGIIGDISVDDWVVLSPPEDMTEESILQVDKITQ